MILNIKPAVRTQVPEITQLLAACTAEKIRTDFDKSNAQELIRSSLFAATVVCDSEVRGLCLCDSTPIPDGCEIGLIYIADGFRSIGFGRKLLSYSLREMRAQERKTAFLWLDENNTDAARFFRRIGFIKDGKRRLISAGDGYEERYRIDI